MAAANTMLQVAAVLLAVCAAGVDAQAAQAGATGLRDLARYRQVRTYAGVPDDRREATMHANGALFNTTLNSLEPGDVLHVPAGTFWLYGGAIVTGLRNVTLLIDGELSYSDNRKEWPTNSLGRVHDSINIINSSGVTITSSTVGVIDGNGAKWWGAIQYLEHQENRPRLFNIRSTSDILVENLHLKDPAYWTTTFTDILRVTIRHSKISVFKDPKATTHTLAELQAFNTDGFDLSGSYVHVHDVDIWNDDDCVCVKDIDRSGLLSQCSEHWLVERVNASGLGLTVGSITPHDETCVNNITFRDSTMHNTYKGIYMKTLGPRSPNATGLISNVLYQNITMFSPEQWAIWIGPAQQADSAGGCSLLWPGIPTEECTTTAQPRWENITLRDITVYNSKHSPGVIIGNSGTPIRNLRFDNVVFHDSGTSPWGVGGYACYGVENGTAVGGTTPVPPCFNGGPQCHADGKCRDSTAMPCCSGAEHRTADCGFFGRCGCLGDSACAVRAEDCCSGKCHDTLDCDLGLACRCDGSRPEPAVVPLEA